MGRRLPVDRADSRRAAVIRQALLRWYDTQRRDLPWRRDRDPYRVWVSEVMLQQTRVDTVVPYYQRWLARFPDINALAGASSEEVLEMWTGLGYYRRARDLHQAARVVRDVHDGAVPADERVLRALPGIGAYTAGAIASIAFDRPAPAVDGNARRVLARLHDLADPAHTELERCASALVGGERPGDLNQALMELGATVCTPRAAACERCPVSRWCRARALGTILDRPAPRRRGRVPRYRVGTAVVVAGGAALVARRPVAGMLGGMWEFPGAVAGRRESALAAAQRVARALAGAVAPCRMEATAPLAVVNHLYSHRRHAYHAYRFGLPIGPFPHDLPAPPHLKGSAAPRRVKGLAAPPRVKGSAAWTALAWREVESLEALPMGAAQRRIARALQGEP
jgi:A/G-specific adenine glycosylase